MFDFIRWKVFLRVKTQKKAELLLARIAKQLGFSIEILSSKPDPNDPAFYEATFTSPLSIERVQEAAFEVLRHAGRIADRWTVCAPQDYEGGKWDFAGWSERPKVSGVVSAQFEIMNYE
jgi:hypothetical protein